MINPSWYWSTTARPPVTEPLRREHGQITVERLPGGCMLYRLVDRENAAKSRRALPHPKRPGEEVVVWNVYASEAEVSGRESG